MKFKIEPRKAFALIDLLLCIFFFGLFLFVAGGVFTVCSAVQDARRSSGVAVQTLSLRTTLDQKVFRVEHVFTNRQNYPIFVGETVLETGNFTFISGVPTNQVLIAGKFYIPTESGLAEVIAPSTNLTPPPSQ